MAGRIMKGATLLLLLSLIGCASGQSSGGKTGAAGTGPAIAAPQPDAARLAPGLATVYLYDDFKIIDRMPTSQTILAANKQGKPILKIDSTSRTGELWEAGATEKYGIHFTGFLKMSAGKHVITTTSNDGVRVTLGGVEIINDPEPHPDARMDSDPITITQAGWYPLMIQYFQRRGTARLTLSWQGPDAPTEAVVPEQALAHLPK